MFGFVVANLDKLSEEHKVYYRACYCGLCKELGRNYGLACRLTLTYDMTFLILLLSAVDGEQVEMRSMRCGVHPTKRQPYFTSRHTAYGAAMNLILAHAQRRDDWEDERKLLSLSQVKLLESSARKARAAYPRQSTAIDEALKALSAMEKEGESNPDLPASAFGSLLGEVFVQEDQVPEAPLLRAFGDALGRFIYLMDAVLDLKGDLQAERYNPLVSVPSERHEELLQLTMAQCADLYERLPIQQHKELLDNILYSGVWTQYRAKLKKEAPNA